MYQSYQEQIDKGRNNCRALKFEHSSRSSSTGALHWRACNVKFYKVWTPYSTKTESTTDSVDILTKMKSLQLIINYTGSKYTYINNTGITNLLHNVNAIYMYIYIFPNYI